MHHLLAAALVLALPFTAHAFSLEGRPTDIRVNYTPPQDCEKFERTEATVYTLRKICFQKDNSEPVITTITVNVLTGENTID